MYLTIAQLADGSGSIKELAELYAAEPALLAAVIAGDDTSAWPPADVVQALQATESIDRFIVQAQGEVDARLAHRGYPLPQDATRFPILVVWTRAIARYHVNRQRDRTNEESGRIERDYRAALQALQLVADGKLSLGAGDPLAPDPTDPDSGAVRLQSQSRLFTRDTLGGL